MRIIDISTGIFETETEGNAPSPKIQMINSMDFDEGFEQSALYTSLQCGTHVLAPSFIVDRELDPAAISDIPLDRFIGPVTVVDIPPGPLTGAEVERYFPKFPSRIILRSYGDFYFFGGAAEDVATYGYDLIGYEGHSHGGQDETSFKRTLLSGGTILLEDLNLSSLNHGGEYYLLAQPINVGQREASLCRAVLLEDDSKKRKQG